MESCCQFPCQFVLQFGSVSNSKAQRTSERGSNTGNKTTPHHRGAKLGSNLAVRPGEVTERGSGKLQKTKPGHQLEFGPITLRTRGWGDESLRARHSKPRRVNCATLQTVPPSP